MEENNKKKPVEKKEKTGETKTTKKETKTTKSESPKTKTKNVETKKSSATKPSAKKSSNSKVSTSKASSSSKKDETKKPAKKETSAKKPSEKKETAKKPSTPAAEVSSSAAEVSTPAAEVSTPAAAVEKTHASKQTADSPVESYVSKEEKKAEAQEKAKTFGEKFVHFFKRTEYSTNQNLRLVSIVLAIILAIGMFQPLMGFSVGIDLKTGDTGVDAVSNKTVPIVPTTSVYPNANIGDLVMHKQLKDFELFGTKIADMEILGLNVYQFATSAFPDFSIIKNIDAALDSEWIDFLKSEQFEELCNNFLGEENAKGVVDVARTLVDISKTTGQALDQVINVLNTLSTAKASLVKSVHAAEDAVTTAENVVTAIMVVFLIGLILSMFKKLPRYLGAGIMTPVCVLFLGLCIGIAIANGVINSAINPADGSINDIIRGVIATNFPDVATLITNFIDLTEVNFVFVAKILVGTGLIITTICVTGCTVLAYVVGARNKGLVGDARN